MTTTPTESWEREFDLWAQETTATFSGDSDGEEYNVSFSQLAFFDDLKSYLRTKLDEAYRKGREDAVEYIADRGVYLESVKLAKIGGTQVATSLEVLEAARHAGEVTDKL